MANDERRDEAAALRRPSPALAVRYGRTRPKPVGLWIIGVTAILATTLAVKGDARVLGVLGTILWALLLTVADRRAQRPRTFLILTSVGALAVLLPLAPSFPDLAASPEWATFSILYYLVVYGGGIPLIVSPLGGLSVVRPHRKDQVILAAPLPPRTVIQVVQPSKRSGRGQ